MNIIDNDRYLLIGHCEESVKLAEIILHITDPHILTVRSGRYINKIDLNTFKQTCGYNRFQRVFRLAIGLSMADLTQLDQKIDLLSSDPIKFFTDIDPSRILSYMAQTIINPGNGIKDSILADYLSFNSSHLPRTSKQFIFLIDEVGLNPESFLTKYPIKTLQDRFYKSSDSSFLFRGRYTFSGLILTSI